MITFPSNPTIGQLHEVGGRSFRFNGTGWVVAAIPGGVVTQTTGQSIVDVMSQKAVTDALGEQKSDSGITSTQDLPSLNLLAGESQKEVNAKQNTLNADHEQRLNNAEAQLSGNQLTFAAIYGYYNFI